MTDNDGILRSISRSRASVAPYKYNGPSLEAACLAAESLTKRARQEAPTWWDSSVGGLALANFDLTGVSLRATDMTGANLAGSDLSEVRAARVILRGAHLERARLDRADLASADLAGAIAGESSFTGALLEDAVLCNANLRFANLSDAVLDGTKFDGADLWGAVLEGADAPNSVFRKAELSEARLAGVNLTAADLHEACLKRTDLRGAKLVGANLQETQLDGAVLDGADLTGALLAQVSLTRCSLRNIRLAGAWLDQTRIEVAQLGGAVGEELNGEFEAACNAYGVLERNFISLGNTDASIWAYRRRRRMGKMYAWDQMRSSWRQKRVRLALRHGVSWATDVFVEWLCDYGESLQRVARAFFVVMVIYAIFFGLHGSLVSTSTDDQSILQYGLQLLLYSAGGLTTVGTSNLELRPSSTLAALVASSESIVGPILLGLFGFVLGNKLRR